MTQIAAKLGPPPDDSDLIAGRESPGDYRARLRVWAGDDVPRGEWEYICSFLGIAPDD